jgi:transposase
MSITAAQPATTPIPVQLSETEFTACIFPHLSMPTRGPKCKLGYHRVFNLIWWILYTGRQWKGLPVPQDPNGTPAIHDTTVYKVFARWADDGSLWQAFLARVAPLSTAKHLDLRVLHGDGTNTVAKTGGMALATRGPNTSRARRSWPSPTIMALCELPSPWLPSMRPTWSCGRRG